MDVNARTDGVGREIAARIVGRSRIVRCLRERVEGMAPLSIPVLLTGEPGSGRSTVAGLLHAFGPTARGHLLAVDASTFAPERGVPLDSTVYLAGIERLSRVGQAWWLDRLRAQQAGTSASHVRWLASTGDSASIRALAPDFDPELERLLVRFSIRVPPLRERREDLPLLVSDLCTRIGRSVGREGVCLSPRAVELLAQCHWPGNVRELEDVIGRAIVFSRHPVIRRAQVLDLIAERAESVDAMRSGHALRERERLLEALRETGGNVTHVAEALGKSRAAVYRLIAAYGIPLAWHRPPEARAGSAARGARASGRAAGRRRGLRARGRR